MTEWHRHLSPGYRWCLGSAASVIEGNASCFSGAALQAVGIMFHLVIIIFGIDGDRHQEGLRRKIITSQGMPAGSGSVTEYL
jgi:hypothetical protein